MANIIVIRDAEAAWTDVSPEWKAKGKPDNPGLRFKRLLPQAAGLPNMQRTHYEPGHIEYPHSHPEAEILYILGGSLSFGREQLGAGDALYIAADTTYSLIAGDQGTDFLRVGLSDVKG
ncbi:MAG: hypothetical protein RL367_353 [Pseudomonadota bacterium]|jgi:quercetin dioxygenase-like cupin family protein